MRDKAGNEARVGVRLDESSETLGEDGFRLAGAAVCVVGAGLMGGSVVLGLRGRVAGIGIVEASQAVCEQATDRGFADWAGSDLTMAARADLVIVATPVRTLIRQVGELGRILRPGAILIDLGSVKEPVVAAMNRLPDGIGAVGGHPMCGKEVSGFAHADGGLYHGARFVLCRTERTTPAAWSAAGQLVEALGATPVEIDPARHDTVVAAISHLPYLVASALALAAGDEAKLDDSAWRLASTGFKDTSRLAGSDVTMMADILLENKAAVLGAIQAAENHLATLRELIETGDVARLRFTLEAARSARLDWEQLRKQGS